MAYDPTAGDSAGTGRPVNCTGGTTTFGGFSITGGDAASFARTSAATLTLRAGVATARNITLTCTSGSVQRTASLQATETINGGATIQRFWLLVCPAGALGPSLACAPSARASGELVTDTVVQRYWVLSCVADYFADGFESTDGLFADGFE